MIQMKPFLVLWFGLISIVYGGVTQINSYSQIKANETAQKPSSTEESAHHSREGVAGGADLWLSKIINGTLHENTASGSGRSFSSSSQHNLFPSQEAPVYNHRRTHQPIQTQPVKQLGPVMIPRRQFAQDRFTPGEATATIAFKNNNAGYSYPQPQASIKDPTLNYVPPKNLYSFPPNIDSIYPRPSASNTPPPPQPQPSPPPKPLITMMQSAPRPTKPSRPEIIALASDTSGSELPPTRDTPPDGSMKEVIVDTKPVDAPADDSPMPTDDSPMPTDDYQHHHHHHDEAPPEYYDHDPHHHDHIVESPEYKSFPDLIYDDHHSHYDYIEHHPEPTTTTTMAPAPAQPRVKTYSYYYIGQKLWYIPLYFTVYFTFYLIYLIVKSIARHKANLPNQFLGATRSIRDLSHKEASRKLDKMTHLVLRQIDDFAKKYS